MCVSLPPLVEETGLLHISISAEVSGIFGDPAIISLFSPAGATFTFFQMEFLLSKFKMLTLVKNIVK